MLYEDEDDLFMGSPKSKFFDIVFNANRDIVKEQLLKIADRYCAMELLLEKLLPEEGEIGIDSLIKKSLYEDADEIHQRMMDFFIGNVGSILSQNE
ncbi:MAG: DUF2018 family protein [Sulfurospirillaceae bacterium]|nr:DUF2018 family protein [Sulfurospirillaceae bacterium]MDD2825927.1 DUF2018 family protein [Sulfurospirillaceae bacterium]